MTTKFKLTDAEREALSQYHKNRLSADGLSSHAKREIFMRMKDLVNGRSPQRVLEMEIERGLRSEKA